MQVRHALGGVGLSLFMGVAVASPVSLDTEQKAAAGLATALIKSDVPRAVNTVIDDARDYADVTLKAVNAATTPEALLATPSGIAVNCSISGSFRARLIDAQPRVLRVRWNDCVTNLRGIDRTLNGPLAITLPSDTFQPQNVLAIRLGNPSAEFLQTWRTETAEQNNDNTLAFHLTLRGDISMVRQWNCCQWIGSSSFVTTGYFDDRMMVENPVGSAAVPVGYKVTMQRLSVSRSTNSVDGVDEDGTRVISGSVSFTQTQPFYGVFTDAYAFQNYQVRRSTDYTTFTEQLSVDGRLQVTWNPFAGSGCMDGLYTFRTRTPLSGQLFSGLFDSGQLVVNSSMVASFYSSANTPPALPTPVNGMLVNMRVRDVGTFNYDVASWSDALNPVGECRP